jgi:hypothetical protein
MNNIKVREFVNLADSKKDQKKTSQDHAEIEYTIHRTTNNYFEIPNNIEIYKLGISEIIVTDTEISFDHNGEEISVPVPTTEELNDFSCLSNAIEEKLMKRGCPYEIIIRFTKYFSYYEKEAIEKIVQSRGVTA